MIQRVQTVYFCAATLISIALFFVPLSLFIAEDTSLGEWHLSLLSVDHNSGNEMTMVLQPYVLIAINILVGLLSVVALMMYKNRKMQINISKANMVLIIALLLCLFYYFDFLFSSELTKGVSIYQYGTYLPMFQLVFTYLAIRSVKHDDELVRSADRLR